MSTKRIDTMIGLTMASVTGGVNDDTLRFTSTDGRTFRFWHEQDCCESVKIEDIAGDLPDLVGSPIVMAEEVSSLDGFDEAAEARSGEYEPESYTWTFYKFATAKGYVTVRWFGTSNGYYSEGVSFEEETEHG
jgi:hypothetical protein